MTSDRVFEGFLQQDLRWNEQEAWPQDQFPNASFHYMKQCGCLVCALANLLRITGIETEEDETRFNPLILNQRLIRCGAFFPNANLDLNAVSRIYPLKYCGPYRYSREKLVDLIGKGYRCLVTVPGVRGAFHFLPVERLTSDDAVVVDPCAGRQLLSEYSQIFEIRPFSSTTDEQTAVPHTQESADKRSADKTEDARRDAAPRIAITFDDGPSEAATNRILQVLEENGARATFFVVGDRVERHADCLRRMIKIGCQIGNQSWNHDFLCQMSEEERRLSLQKTSDAIQRACGVTPTVMRPPGGEINMEVRGTAEDLGLSCINWSIDPWDWHSRDAHKTIEYVLERAGDGDIVLLHDLDNETADAAGVLIPELVRRGFELVTVEKLASDRGGLQPGMLYLYF